MTTLFPVIILAGGLATRLHPLTETIPKALIEINGISFLTHQLNLLYRSGIRKIILAVGYLGDMIENHIGDGSQFGLQIHYSFDGKSLLGTGGCIKKALPLLGDHFFVLYGDSYLPCDYLAIQKAYLENKQSALMTVFKNSGKWDHSNIEVDNGKILVYDKKNRTVRMKHIDYGLGVFNKQAFDHLAENETYDLADLYQKLLKKNQLAAYEVQERFYEIGSFAGMKELAYYFESHLPMEEDG